MNFQISKICKNSTRHVNIINSPVTAAASDEKMIKEIKIKNNFQLMTNLSLFAY
jgi:hypothetical protein